ncbi:PREDICTED: probable mediator of RNA polymerase II transcription subunit 26b [Lupinus angustifolius]|uniref:probable mediator of RNA polymerase II transcription subunit 26b n=1 Tax=Lupinus angustifolius TaxID=3871 RepID=UPI00092E33DA|nr:PREDICTED: probable mediator of RNA polymerase II transcription subunit 26b [Lupinus angustifolius]
MVEFKEECDKLSHIKEIKRLLEDETKDETEIINSLQMLRIIVQSIEDLKATTIGRTVRNLQCHGSKKISHIAKEVTSAFKGIVRQHLEDNFNLSVRTKGHDPPTSLDEYVLPTPPMDRGIPMVHIPPEEFTTFFDELDDDGNPIISNKIKTVHKNKINQITENTREIRLLNTSEGSALIGTARLHKEKEELMDNLKKPKISRPSQGISEAEMKHEYGRNPSTKTKRKHEIQPLNTKHSLSQCYGKQKVEVDVNNERRIQMKKDKVNQRSNSGSTQSRGSSSDAAIMEEKLENSKRKLHQGYLQHEKARRNTKLIVAGICDIPKDKCSSSRWRFQSRSEMQLVS